MTEEARVEKVIADEQALDEIFWYATRHESEGWEHRPRKTMWMIARCSPRSPIAWGKMKTGGLVPPQPVMAPME